MSSFEELVTALSTPRVPGDVILEILKKLPVKTLARFNFVSESFHAMIKSPTFKSLHARGASQVDQLLLVQAGNRLAYKGTVIARPQWLNFWPDSPAGENASIVGCCNGVIFLGGRRPWPGLPALAWNPATKEAQEIPLPFCPSLGEPSPWMVGFGHDPETQDVKVVLVVWYFGTESRRDSRSYLYSKCHNSWRETSRFFSPCRFNLDSCVTFEGNPYWASNPYCGFVVCFDMSRERFGAIRSPDTPGNRIPDCSGLQVVRDSLSLFFLEHVAVGDIQLWTMEGNIKNCVYNGRNVDNNITWSKKFSIRPHFPFDKFLGCWTNGDLLFFKDGEIFSYNPQLSQNNLKHLPAEQRQFLEGFDKGARIRVFSYVESLA